MSVGGSGSAVSTNARTGVCGWVVCEAELRMALTNCTSSRASWYSMAPSTQLVRTWLCEQCMPADWPCGHSLQSGHGYIGTQHRTTREPT